MRNIKFYFLVLFIFIISGLLFSCIYNPENGQLQIKYFSENEKISKDTDKYLKNKYGVYKDKYLREYINEIGEKIADYSQSNLKYYFTILDTPVLNTFSLVQGNIYITRGLLAQLSSEAELAFVLGHEIAHIEVLENNSENDFKADSLGAEYAFKAGYNPMSFLKYLQNLNKQEKYERIKKLKNKITEFNNNNDFFAYEIGQERYLGKIKNIFMGRPKLAGTINNKGEYQNIPYRLKFILPANYIISASDDSNCLLYFKHYSLPIEGDLRIEYAKEKFALKEFALKVDAREVKKIKKQWLNYFSEPAYQTINRLRYSDWGETYEIITFFANENIGYKLRFNLKSSVYSSQRNSIDSLLSSVNFLSKEAVRKNGGYRLKLHKVKKGDTLQSISKKYFKKPNQGINRLIAFNSFYKKNDKLYEGQLIKIPKD